MSYRLSEEEMIQLDCKNRGYCIKIQCTPHRCSYKALEARVAELQKQVKTSTGHVNSFMDEVKELRAQRLVLIEQLANLTGSRESAEVRAEVASLKAENQRLVNENADWMTKAQSEYIRAEAAEVQVKHLINERNQARRERDGAESALTEAQKLPQTAYDNQVNIVRLVCRNVSGAILLEGRLQNVVIFHLNQMKNELEAALGIGTRRKSG